MPQKISIIPQPSQLTVGEGQFCFNAQTTLAAEGAAAPIAAFLRADLARAAGLELPSGPAGASAVEFRLDETLSRLGKEGYRLEVTPQRVLASAPQAAGLFYALQSLRQLLPAAIFSPKPAVSEAWCVPCVEIEDSPRFGWRSAMLDVGRHFAPKVFVLKFIDLLALHKLNTFHWHLTDDQGWRIEIKKYPRLTEVGAWRKETIAGHFDGEQTEYPMDGKPHGGFYTQDDIREVVAYAKERFINVVPEIEMPGHSQAAVAAYPELGNTGRPLEVSSVWGIHEHIYNAGESTIRFMTGVLDEVLALFPSQFIHVGGDEAPKKEWRESAAAQARIRELGLKDEDELQSYFIRRMDQYLAGRGRRLIGWDEILEGGLAENAAVMSWRGEEGGITAANAGHDVVMAPWHHTYLDYYQSDDRDKEPLAIGGFLPLEHVYSYEPIPEEIDPVKAQHVLGTQAQLWREYIPTSEHTEYMAFPRLCALAEVAWTPAEKKEYEDFTARLVEHLKRLDALNVNYHKLD
jgi:hexosaminidase